MLYDYVICNLFTTLIDWLNILETCKKHEYLAWTEAQLIHYSDVMYNHDQEL